MESFRGKLRIRLPRTLFAGKQKWINLGLDDTELNREITQHKVKEIELDLKTKNFDYSLDKYKPASHLRVVRPDSLPFENLWDQYIKVKTLKIEQTSLVMHFRPIARRVEKYGKPIKSRQDATKFLLWLDTQVSAETSRKTVQNLSACYEWGIQQGLVKENPFEGLSKAIRRGSSSKLKPFSRKERERIIRAFESDPFYSHYAPFVKFLFMTGCRTSEAVGLCWRHVPLDCSFVEFKEAVVHAGGKLIRKTTKTGEPRVFPCNPGLKQLLLSIRPSNSDPDAPVFPSPRYGKPINASNFVKRAWKKVLFKAGVEYRKQYLTRHSFITFALEQGVDAKDVASWVGNSPEVIYQNYATPNTDIEVPDIFEED